MTYEQQAVIATGKMLPAMTLENAKAWYATSEKYVFVTDLMSAQDIEYDPHSLFVERFVNNVESRFEELLVNAGLISEDNL